MNKIIKQIIEVVWASFFVGEMCRMVSKRGEGLKYGGILKEIFKKFLVFC